MREIDKSPSIFFMMFVIPVSVVTLFVYYESTQIGFDFSNWSFASGSGAKDLWELLPILLWATLLIGILGVVWFILTWRMEKRRINRHE